MAVLALPGGGGVVSVGANFRNGKTMRSGRSHGPCCRNVSPMPYAQLHYDEFVYVIGGKVE